jgi:hypothetical protein
MRAVGKIRGVQIVVRLDGMGATGFCGHTRNQIAVDAVHYAAAKEKPDHLKVIGLFRDQRESKRSDPFVPVTSADRSNISHPYVSRSTGALYPPAVLQSEKVQ